MRIFKALLLPLLFCLLSACASAPASPDIEVSEAALEGDFSTFVIKPIRGQGHRQDLEERFNTALRLALTAKGYREQAQKLDMGGTGLPSGAALINPTAAGTSPKPGKH